MCPSIETRLSERTCEICGLYFASRKSVLNHTKIVHEKHRMSAARVHPVHIILRRENEALCVLQDDIGNEDAEWIDVEELDLVDESEIPTEVESNLPLIENLSDWLRSPWTE